MTESGKTTLAVSHCRQHIERTGWPALVLDLEGNLPDALAPVVTDEVQAAVTQVWGRRGNCLFRPVGEGTWEKCEQLLRACRRAGHVVLLVDGSWSLLTARAAPDSAFLELLRGHRHAPAWMLLTTQHFSGDIPQALLACSPHLYVFRTLQPAVLRRLEEDYGIDPQAAATLQQGECLVLYQGFGGAGDGAGRVGPAGH